MKLSEIQIDDFNSDGYLFLPKLFSDAEIDVLRAELPRIFSLDREEIERDEISEEIRGAFAMHQYSTTFAALLRHPRLLEPAHQILGSDVYCHQFKIITKQPFGKLDFPWHQDFASWHAHDGMPEPKAMNYAVFLDDVNEFNGPIAFIPGSHREGELASEAETLPGITPLYTMNAETIATLVEKNGIVSPKGPAGSAVFFHSCMAHTTAPNISPWPRNIVYLTCNRTDNFIRTPTRPYYYAGHDFEPIFPLPDNCLSTGDHVQRPAT
jgi:ectoine hydroxylase